MSGGWCDHCQNTGELDCYCGGDQCVCDNNGTYPCPHCDGMSNDGPDGGEYPFDDEVPSPPPPSGEGGK